jgi:hypothetical protein
MRSIILIKLGIIIMYGLMNIDAGNDKDRFAEIWLRTETGRWN